MKAKFQENPTTEIPAEILVGRKLKELRMKSGYSLRALAERSGLNINTLSLVENGRSSPSVSTLQQLAAALDVPLVAFFESDLTEQKVVFTPAGTGAETEFGRMKLQNLGLDLAGRAVQPFVVTLDPGGGSGDQLIVHTGHEFVYCLSGQIHYFVDQEEFNLTPGDSLLFEAHLPHCWENNSVDVSQILLILIPADERDEPDKRHFVQPITQKESIMKIAVTTEDGKTISRHFGRAPHFLVLTVEEGKIVDRELRNKLGHSQFDHGHHDGSGHGEDHGQDSHSHHKHAQIAESISDCSVVLCGGMGMGAYEGMQRVNITPIVTRIQDIETAVQEYIAGKLINQTELLH